MWTVIKFDKKRITLLKKDLREKIDSKFKFDFYNLLFK